MPRSAVPGVAEAAAIGVKHPKWDERPLLLVVRDDGSDVSEAKSAIISRSACRQMVAARRDPVRRRPAAHRHRQAFSKKGCASEYRDYSFANAEEMVGRD